MSSLPTLPFSLFAESGGTDLAQSGYFSHLPGGHPTVTYTAEVIEARPVGSGVNGPDSADCGKVISNIKHAWTTTQVSGEIDGLVIAMRQGGPDAGGPGDPRRSDAGAILVNTVNLGKTGFNAAFEAATSNIRRGDYVTTAHVQTQVGAINTDNAGQQGYGFVAVAKVGMLTTGVQVQTEGGSWQYAFRAMRAGITTFSVNGAGAVVCNSIKQPLTTPVAGNAPGVAGTMVWDTNYVYVCTATNVWRRTPLVAW